MLHKFRDRDSRVIQTFSDSLVTKAQMRPKLLKQGTETLRQRHSTRVSQLSEGRDGFDLERKRMETSWNRETKDQRRKPTAECGERRWPVNTLNL